MKILCLLTTQILIVALHLHAQLAPEAAVRIDAILTQAMQETSVPGVSISVIKDGKIAYVRAYGSARLDPPTPARPETRYSIGSVSKQFMAMAILLLVQDGKLRLDDPVAKYLPDLTRAKDITLRQLLSHTSGYTDYYPLDYVAPFMTRPVTPLQILDRFARIPLDFEPGTQYQYSNTNFVAAGLILEKVSGMKLAAFMEERIFQPLGMKSPIDLGVQSLTESDAKGYTRFGLGPVRPVRPEANGWLFAAGQLAMTAHDLARWNLGLLERRLIKPELMDEMIKAPRLRNGAPTSYGLGVAISNDGGHPKVQHGGAVAGFVSSNTVWLDQSAAVAVLSNLDGSRVTGLITNQIRPLLLAEKEDPQAGEQLARARRIFGQLQEGKIDRSLLTPDADYYFTPQVLADAASSLRPLGPPAAFEQTRKALRGGMTLRNFQITFSDGKVLQLSTFSVDDGRFAQYLIQ